MTLAIDGGKPAVTGQLKPFNTIGREEAKAAHDATLKGPLSGYLGGQRAGGYHVERLERAWEEEFNVNHAVACNSATSGLLLACLAAGIDVDSRVVTTPFSMSATVAVPTFLGAGVEFDDIEADTFSLLSAHQGIVITTNLFGHPARQTLGSFVIEDNAHAIYAKDGNRYAGTIGNIGVFSGNIHKQIQCGEGGMCVTNDDALAEAMRMARNHGEMVGFQPGLNLRLTEIQAAIWYQQLLKAPKILADRVEIAENIIEATKDWPGLLIPPVTRDGCTHSFYMIGWKTTLDRRKFVEAMRAEGVPLREGYVGPLYRLPALSGGHMAASTPITEWLADSGLVTYENCSYSPTKKQLQQFAQAFRKVCDGI